MGIALAQHTHTNYVEAADAKYAYLQGERVWELIAVDLLEGRLGTAWVQADTTTLFRVEGVFAIQENQPLLV